MSDSYDGRIITAKVNRATVQSIPDTTQTTVLFTTTQHDSTSSYNSSTGLWTCPKSGWYRVSASVGFAANATNGRECYFAVDGTSVDACGYIFGPSGTGSAVLGGSSNFYLRAGQTLSVKVSQNSGGALNLTANGSLNYLTVEGINSPATMSATERVSGLRNSTSGQSISANTETTIQYANSEEDTHGMWSTSTHDWTVPVAGRYSVNGFLRTTGAETVTAGQIFRVKLYVDGSYSKELFFIRYLNTVVGTEQAAAFSGEVKLNAGQKVSIVLLSTVACTLSSSAGVNWAGIKLIK